MRSLIVSAVAVTSLAFAGMALAGGNTDGTGIKDSPHDFADDVEFGVSVPGSELGKTGAGWNGRNEICRVCHVPHDHGKSRYLNGLLWNHDVSTAVYTMYDSTWSSTLDNTQSAQPDGTAKLCLGCHDGTVAIDSFDRYSVNARNIGDAAYDGGGFKVPRFLDGTNLDLRGTHPLSITYDAAVDTGLHAATDTMGTSGTIADVLDNGKVQCSTCHDVHNQESVPGTHLLRVTTLGDATGVGASELCLTCHIK